MGIDVRDEREFAWLLVRSDTLTGNLIDVWQSIPIRSGSILWASFGYPLRFVTLFGTLLIVGLLMLTILIAAAQIPVALFAYVHPILGSRVWLVLLGGIVILLGGYLTYAITAWLQVATRGDPPMENAQEGNGRQPVHIGHESARNGLFAGLSIAIGIALQCTAVVLGPQYFGGPVDTGWQWPFLFGEQLFNTMLMGIPAGFLPTLAAIRPAAPLGQLLMTGVEFFYVAGVIAMVVLVLSSTFKVRELFNGTTRDLADHLESFDLSGGQGLIIHRVAVLRPLDESEVISLTKAAFIERVKEQP